MSNDFVSVSRDPFAREDIVRETVETSGSCKWCGNTRRGGKLFHYGVQPDSINGRVNWIDGLFCGISCMRTYHGG